MSGGIGGGLWWSPARSGRREKDVRRVLEVDGWTSLVMPGRFGASEDPSAAQREFRIRTALKPPRKAISLAKNSESIKMK